MCCLSSTRCQWWILFSSVAIKELHALTGPSLPGGCQVERSWTDCETLSQMFHWLLWLDHLPPFIFSFAFIPFCLTCFYKNHRFSWDISPKTADRMAAGSAAARGCFCELKTVNMWTHATLMCPCSIISNAAEHVERLLVCRTAENVSRVSFC